MKRSKISGILFTALSLSGCVTAKPRGDFCYSDPAESHGLRCIDPLGTLHVVPFEESANFICMTPKEYASQIKAASRK